MKYYRNAFVAELLGLLAALSLLLTASRWLQTQRRTLAETAREAVQLAQTTSSAEANLRKVERDSQQLLAFEKAWDTSRRPAAPNDLGNYLRNRMATLATQAGLTSEGTTVPAEPKKYPVGGSTVYVQEISINVTSESLPALIAWLGEVEGQFPYARIETLSLSSYASHSVQLGVTLYHPVEEAESSSWKRSALADVSRK